jgi:aldehyde:ferredoxin oxidoreductase
VEEDMKNGYMEKILKVDLSNRTSEIITVSESVRKQYVGGSGLAAWYLLSHTDPEKFGALEPENTFALFTGPAAGTPVYSSSRFTVSAKSPLTQTWGEANSGGKFAQDLKSNGFDGIVIENASSEPVNIWIDKDTVEIKDATHCWGKDTYELSPILKSEYGDAINFVCCGPAGEKQILLSAVMNDGVDGRAAGRGGLGAVLGSKNLKCIVVSKGNHKTPLYDRKSLIASIGRYGKAMKEQTESVRAFGTSCGMEFLEMVGRLPVKNWSKGSWPHGAEKISGQKMVEKIGSGNYHCGHCIIGCGQAVKIDQGPYKMDKCPGPEYETSAMFGANCLIDDIGAIAKANDLCNRYGLDTISTGGVIAFCMEAYERGIVSQKDTDGIEMTWGNAEGMIEMVKAIGEGIGFGGILGKGVRQVAQILGREAEEFAVHVKGLELPAHDPRARYSAALSYATSNRGACHLNIFGMDFEDGSVPPEGLGYDEVQDPHKVEGKAGYSIKMQDLMAFFDAFSVCKFLLHGGIGLSALAEWLNCITGWGLGIDDLLEIGARIFTVKRLYNNRIGITRKDDILPLRISNFARDSGPAKDIIVPQAKLLNDYYKLRNWTEFGEPTPEALKALHIGSDVV